MILKYSSKISFTFVDYKGIIHSPVSIKLKAITIIEYLVS